MIPVNISKEVRMWNMEEKAVKKGQVTTLENSSFISLENAASQCRMYISQWFHFKGQENQLFRHQLSSIIGKWLLAEECEFPDISLLLCEKVFRQRDTDGSNWSSGHGHKSDKPDQETWERHWRLPLHITHLPRILLLEWVPVCVDHSKNWPSVA